MFKFVPFNLNFKNYKINENKYYYYYYMFKLLVAKLSYMYKYFT